MTRILSLFELLKHALTREAEIFPLPDPCSSFGSEFKSRFGGFIGGLCLLRFYRLTLPSARHRFHYSSGSNRA